MIDFSSRHSGNLDGKLSELDIAGAVAVNVAISPRWAGSPAIQHTAWMTCNLLARLQHVVSDILIDCDEDATLHHGIIPRATAGRPFTDELLRSVNALRLLPATRGTAGRETIYVGPGNGDGIRAVGDGWIGGASGSGVAFEPHSALPFGPYIAACFAVAELFRKLRLKAYAPCGAAFYDGWRATPITAFPEAEETGLSFDIGQVTLAGVGAVGSAWLHALWATPGLQMRAILIDPDTAGVDETNLNRYCLFGTDDVGHLKATRAASILTRDGLELHGYDRAFDPLDQCDDVLVCAVDSNIARASVQSSYRPTMLMGSTDDLRADVLLCTLPGQNACIRCYNEPERGDTDEAIRDRLARLTKNELNDIAAAASLEAEELASFVSEGKCSEATERLRLQMRIQNSESTHRFAISFVSVLAGVVLAMETCKAVGGHAGPLNDDANRISLQLFRPDRTLAASRLARDSQCPMCRESAALRIWQGRYVGKPPNQRPTRT